MSRRETTDIQNPLVIHPPADWKPLVFTDKEHGWLQAEEAKPILEQIEKAREAKKKKK